MQGDEAGLHACLLKTRQQIGREVQTRGRRSDRTVGLGVDRLVVGAVLIILRSLGGDVRRQRHGAPRLDRLVQVRAGQLEIDDDLTPVALGGDERVEHRKLAGAIGVLSEDQLVAGRETLARAHEGAPAGGPQALVQGRLNGHHALAAQPSAVQTRRDHAGVVEHQQVSSAKFARQIAHVQVGQGLPGLYPQHARRVPGRNRTQGDGAVGQFEVEIGSLHVARVRPRAPARVKRRAVLERSA